MKSSQWVSCLLLSDVIMICMPKGSLQAYRPSLGMGAGQSRRLTALGQGTEEHRLCKYPGAAIWFFGRGRIPRVGQELEVRGVPVARPN